MRRSPNQTFLSNTDSISATGSSIRRKACGGLLARRERWSLTWRGWMALLFGLLGLASLFLFGLHPFFAVTSREKTDVLVVEGWIRQYAIHAAAEEFRRSNYSRIYTTGGPVTGLGGYVSDYSTSASIGAGNLRKVGVAPEFIQMVPSRVSGRDRTYSSALALRDWFHEHNVSPASINVVTEELHARRTRLLFQKALGDGIKVGIIAIPSPDYDASRWWRYSEGVREMLGETIAYIYVRVFFWPDSAK
jgi:uncharacterized SAM-binding protein YcdF (DUF218 family)